MAPFVIRCDRDSETVLFILVYSSNAYEDQRLKSFIVSLSDQLRREPLLRHFSLSVFQTGMGQRRLMRQQS
ncbi:hypothetical protein GN244_ATG01611 [Phytophthora infestans]|uniref:Uncharacterized protein n=1 Tax=Phytophthora infestans TaxID=4787 RepID=A0A833TFT7_PHYIN|nr:hypothetical protein GN244_ATG01611 [Phytophthora infestans]KAF4131893.1 hypothetical protein GN958_ATG18926 [Phytophthora infestans]